MLDKTRSSRRKVEEALCITLNYKLRLLPEKNITQAVAFNADDTLRSSEVITQIGAHFAERRPSLHAIVVGIQEYENPRLALRYAVVHARLMAATLRERSTSLF
jgi:hypothetical protein